MSLRQDDAICRLPRLRRPRRWGLYSASSHIHRSTIHVWRELGRVGNHRARERMSHHRRRCHDLPMGRGKWRRVLCVLGLGMLLLLILVWCNLMHHLIGS